jgi:hypothetical protein
MRSPLARWAALLAILLSGLVGVSRLLSIPGVNSRNALRLQRGMTEFEVESILGSTGILDRSVPRQSTYRKHWNGFGTLIVVEFSENEEKVVSGSLVRSFSDHEERIPLVSNPYGVELSVAQKISIWLGLRAFW